ncbi:MAG: AtpZ/AtpI family protein [Peptococcia bacterium]|jgi:hypothetical protein
MAKKNKGWEYINFALSFGLTLAITTYFLYWGGTWLDRRLGTEPLFMLLGILLAVSTVFRQMIREIGNIEKDKQVDQDQEKEQEKEQEKDLIRESDGKEAKDKEE